MISGQQTVRILRPTPGDHQVGSEVTLRTVEADALVGWGVAEYVGGVETTEARPAAERAVLNRRGRGRR
ncbi:MAG: hypothetical protein RL375_4904 [Pseudomonadota bacterium]